MKLLRGSPGTSPLDLTVIDSREWYWSVQLKFQENLRVLLWKNRETGAIFLVLSLKSTMFNQGNEYFTPRIYLHNWDLTVEFCSLKSLSISQKMILFSEWGTCHWRGWDPGTHSTCRLFYQKRRKDALSWEKKKIIEAGKGESKCKRNKKQMTSLTLETAFCEHKRTILPGERQEIHPCHSLSNTSVICPHS